MMNPENALCQVARAATIREPTVTDKYFLTYIEGKFTFIPQDGRKPPHICFGTFTSEQLNNGMTRKEYILLKIKIANFINFRRP